MRTLLPVWAFVALTFAIFFLMYHHFFAFFVAGSLAILPIIFIKYLDAQERNTLEALKRKVLAACKDFTPRFIHSESGTVIALNEPTKEIIFAYVDGPLKAYPYTSIRNWTIKKETAPEITAGDGPFKAHGNARRATMSTGLFFNVKDIDHPEWRISMGQDSDRKRWFEILNQAINEGGAA
jgi:Domain of unknown function (DUF4755)